MAAAISTSDGTVLKMAPGPAELLQYLFITPATADSADTLDVSAYVGSIDFLICWDQTTGDIVTATESSSDITIDTGGGTTEHTYAVLVMGTKK